MTTLQMPSTSTKPTLVTNGGIEYNGKLYISDETTNLPLGYPELWFVARHTNDIKDANQKTIAPEFLAKIMSTKTTLGCQYEKEVEDLLSREKKKMYVL